MTEQYDMARSKHKELAAVDREIAERFAYLGGVPDMEAGRAGHSGTLRQYILWNE
jgi:hypothetical protein